MQKADRSNLAAARGGCNRGASDCSGHGRIRAEAGVEHVAPFDRPSQPVKLPRQSPTRRGGRAWLNAPVLKTGRPSRVSGVRIPPPPPRHRRGPAASRFFFCLRGPQQHTLPCNRCGVQLVCVVCQRDRSAARPLRICGCRCASVTILYTASLLGWLCGACHFARHTPGPHRNPFMSDHTEECSISCMPIFPA